MSQFEGLLGVLLLAALLAALARRIGAPYPAFLALVGAVLAFVPGTPRFSIDPDLALALFVAPVLLDAAYDASPRDLRDNWIAVTSLAVVSVIVTTAAVALVARRLVPAMPWPAAIALGAIVSPPDAAAALAVLRQLRPPHRILTVLEGESLLNDATALLIYRLAVGAVAMSAFSIRAVVPTILLVVAGSIVAGLVLARLALPLIEKIRDVPTAIIVQFVSTFGVWILADRLGFSSILTMVAYAIAVARRAPERTPARIRLPSYAVWETAVFVLNVLAFVFIGLQIRPILSSLNPRERTRFLQFAGSVLLAVIAVRILWVMTHNTVARWWIRRHGFHPRRPIDPPTVGSGIAISWSGMRGIVTLAAALALPDDSSAAPFPFRDLIVVTAFSIVLGTLVVQGLTLKPLLRLLDLRDDDPVGRETAQARQRALDAALETLDGDDSPAAQSVRHELTAHLAVPGGESAAVEDGGFSHEDCHRRALAAARRVAFDMRARDEIGDDAFHRIEEELDWLEMGSAGREGA
ncbi:MAG TPA: sodium:proton antiporter [Thermoanaerobaculia bacterium]|nr:sodium:proton antiporter [Thermoanaerobaculia bacterium]